MKAFKLEVLIIDFDGLGVEEIKTVIENARYPNRCISPAVMASIERDIGEWDDDHPLNKFASMESSYKDIFQQDNE